MDTNGALEKAYKCDGAYLLAVCRRYVCNDATAEDMLQEGFVTAFLNFDKFRDKGPGSLRAWLSRIMATTCLHYLRRNDVLRDCDPLESVDYRLAQDDSLTRRVDGIGSGELYNMVLSLPHAERLVVDLLLFEDFSRSEAAEMLGLKVGTVNMRLHRARAHLAEMILNYERK